MDDERTIDVREIVDKNPGKYLLFKDNPLDEGCFLESITCDDSKSLAMKPPPLLSVITEYYSFIKTLDLESGKAYYHRHSEEEGI